MAKIRISYGGDEEDTVIELEPGQAAQISVYCGQDGQPRHYTSETFDQDDRRQHPDDIGSITGGTLIALMDAAK